MSDTIMQIRYWGYLIATTSDLNFPKLSGNAAVETPGILLH